jgi:DNA-binding protein H-NS
MVNVKSMTFDKLLITKGKIETEIELRSAEQRSQLLKAIGKLGRGTATKSDVADHGRPHALKGRKLSPQYRNPKNRKETWAGRGNRPRWLVAALKRGKKLEAFAIR